MKLIITVLLGFVVTPLIIRWIGKEGFGIYKLLESWSSFLGLFEFGLFGGLLTLFSRFIGKESHENTKRAITQGVRIYLWITLLIFLLTLVTAFFIPSFVKSTTYSENHIRISYLLISFTFLFIISTPFRAYLESNQRADMVHKTLLIQLIITSISSVIFSFLGWGVLGPSIGLFLGALFGHLIILLLGNKMLPFKLKPSDLKVKSGPLTGQIKKLARDNFLISLANKLSFTADSIIIGTIYSPALVAPFFLTQRLPSLAMQQLQNLTHATWASLVDYHHKDEKEKFEEKFLETLKFLLIAAGNGLLPIIIFNDDFVRLWVGRTNYISLEFTIVSCFVALAVAIDFYFSTLLKGVGVVKEQVKPEFVFGILNVILSIILAKFVSVSGPVWATFFSVTLIVVVSKVPLIKATFGIKFRRVILGAILPFIWTMVMGYAFYQLKLKLNIAINWVSLPLLVATLMLIFLSATWLFILNQKEKRIWLERFKRILKLN